MKKRFALFLIVISFNTIQAQNNLKLWYDKPANKWFEALPIGNGHIGAMVFGRIDQELIQLNESSLWSGGPMSPSVNPDAFENLSPLREALFAEDYENATALCKKMQGYYSETYLPLGDLKIVQDFGDAEPTEYYRDLSLNSGMATTKFTINGVCYQREIFISAPANVLAIRLTSSKKGKLNFNVALDSQLKKATSTTDNNHLIIDGKAPARVDPTYFKAKGREPILWEDTTGCNGMRFRMELTPQLTDGQLQVTYSGIEVKNATEVVLYLTAATSFNGYDKCPDSEGKDEKLITKKVLSAIESDSYKQIKTAHIADYTNLYNRVEISLGSPLRNDSVTALPWDKRLKAYTAGGTDFTLEETLYQYGRYLLISSSRPGGQAANLQGIWNPKLRAPWSSNYTININAEMNYWAAEQTNLSELHQPLLQLIENLSHTGKYIASEFYHTRGWVAHHNSDIWALSTPVGNKGQGSPVWANWYMGGNWLCQHLWEHYDYTGDINFLKHKAYPIMKQAALFCFDWLIEKDGYLVTAPSTSPENLFLHNGKKHAVTIASTMDISICWDLFTNLIRATEILDVDTEFRAELIAKRAKLLPLQIGSKGQLLEWHKEYKEENPQHRHVSHLFGLHPGNQITPIQNPELAKACQKSLDLRGDEGTGWSKAWKINFRARLYDGNHAYKMLRQLLTFTDKTSLRQSGGTYPNFFNAHPPFQIDGNFGSTAGITEMVMQSHAGSIHLLPALPDAWQKGNLRGVKARGGFEVAVEWADGALKMAEIKSLVGNKCTIRSRTPFKVKGVSTQLKTDDFGYTLSFATEKGKSYVVKAVQTQ